jgi:protein-disulfide isomerase
MSKKSSKSSPARSGSSANSAAQTRREALRQQQAAELKKAKTRKVAITTGIIVVVVALVAALAVFLTQRNKLESGDQVTPASANADKTALTFGGGPLTLDIYYDYQCPGCATWETFLKDQTLSLINDGSITANYHPMTFLDGLQGLKIANSSTRAGVAAMCADNVGVFEDYHYGLLAIQPEEGEGYPDETLTTTVPANIGLVGEKLDTFKQCYANNSTLDFVNNAAETNRSAKDADGNPMVKSTPTFRANGKLVTLSADAQQTMATPEGLLNELKKTAGV